MYKNIIRIAFLFATGICMTACSSGDDNIADNTIPVAPGTKENVVTLTGTISAGEETTRALAEDGITTSWTDGDVIAVHYQKTDDSWATVQGTISNITNNAHDAKFTAKLIDPKNSSNIGLAYPYVHVLSSTHTKSGPAALDFDYTCLNNQGGTTVSITNAKQDLAKTTDADIAITISGATATLNKVAELKNQVCIAKFTLYEGTSGSTTPFNTTSLTVTDNTHSKSYSVTTTKTNEFFVVLPEITGENSTPASITIKAIGQQRYSGDPVEITSARTVYNYGDYIVVDPSTRQAYTATVSSTPTDNEYSQTYGNSKLKAGKFYAQPIYYPIQDYTPVAVIAHVGEVTNYCSKFIALALEDVYSTVQTLSNAQSLIGGGSWLNDHTIKISDILYDKLVSINGYNITADGGKIDEVQENAQDISHHATTDKSSAPLSNGSTALNKGWRVPCVTDIRYILSHLTVSPAAPSATDPQGIMDHQGKYKIANTSTYNSDAGYYPHSPHLVNKINDDLCKNKNTPLDGEYYWLSSQVKDTNGDLQSSKAWRYNFAHDYFVWTESQDKSKVRLVFAY